MRFGMRSSAGPGTKRRLAMVAALVVVGVFGAIGQRSSAAEDREILVAAAISLKDALSEIGPLYERQTGTRVRFSLGASGLLQRQIESGAPIDVFASAGEKQMDQLQAKGLIFRETRRTIARNALALVVPVDSTAIRRFEDLAQLSMGRLAIGNPRTVPAGQYAEETLRKLGVWERLQPRIVLAENVRQVLDYVVRGEADAGIVYASDATGMQGKATVAAQAPKGSHRPILYPAAVVKDSGSRAEAERFIALMLSDAGQAILRKHGFLGAR